MNIPQTHSISILNLTSELVPQVLELMKELAKFEHYIDHFTVTESDLLNTLGSQAPDFACFVAVNELGLVLGYAVLTFTTFTFDLRPTATLKELYVSQASRGKTIGTRLFLAVQQECKRMGVARLNWLVMKGNNHAAMFYESLGGYPSPKWELFEKVL